MKMSKAGISAIVLSFMMLFSTPVYAHGINLAGAIMIYAAMGFAGCLMVFVPVAVIYVSLYYIGRKYFKVPELKRKVQLLLFSILTLLLLAIYYYLHRLSLP